MVSASRQIQASPGPIFELIADPAAQPSWDGNDNLATAPAGQRVRRTGDVFTMTLTHGGIRENHVVEFDEGRRIAWRPAEPGPVLARHANQDPVPSLPRDVRWPFARSACSASGPGPRSGARPRSCARAVDWCGTSGVLCSRDCTGHGCQDRRRFSWWRAPLPL